MTSSVVNLSPFYTSISLEDSLLINGCRHATHCMLYSTPDSNGIPFVLCQMRFDGLIGFVGGGVDIEDVNIDHILDAMNREMDEEINYTFESVTKEDWICSHSDTDASFIQHFFAKQLSFQKFRQIGRTHVRAHHFPIESLGLMYVPINGSDSSVSHEFLKNFLRQRFAGNGKQQFIESIRKRKLLSDEQIVGLEYISRSVPNDAELNSSVDIGIEVKAMPITRTGVHYYDETVDVTYGLMIIRDSGLFDFVGTQFVDSNDKNSMIESINDSLKKDLGSHTQPIVFNEGSIPQNFDNDSSNVFNIQLNSSQFIEIETNLTETQNFSRTSFGIFRIPFQVRGQTEKADNYVNRFVRGFLNQNFVNNSRNQLKSIFERKCFDEKNAKICQNIVNQ